MKNSKDVLVIEVERSKINREKSLVVLDKALLLYFSFIFVAVIGLINNYLDLKKFNLIVGMSLIILAIGLIPYVITMKKEEKRLDQLIDEARGRRGGKK